MPKHLTGPYFRGGQGTSAVNLIAAKALIFKLAKTPEFIQLQHGTIENASRLGRCLAEKGYRLVTGGTDNHQVVLDLEDRDISGGEAERLLERCGIVLNRNVVPRDAQKPGRVSGLRVGTAAVTTRGMGSTEIRRIAEWIDQVLKQPDNKALHDRVRDAVRALCSRFPVYAGGHAPWSVAGTDG